MTFDKFNFDEKLQKALADVNYIEPTPIQDQTISKILEGNDLLGIAKTGTGKTAAFCLPILQLMLQNEKEVVAGSPRTIIIAPTRELVAQIGEDMKNYAKYTPFNIEIVFGGVAPGKQIELLSKRVDILVATPTRLVDLIREKVVDLDGLDYFVIDEADKVIQVSSSVDLKFISYKLPSKIQSLFFSATMSEDIEKLANELLKKAIRVRIDGDNDKGVIYEKVLYVKKENKEKLLLDLLKKKEVKSAIIIMNTKLAADNLVRFLTENGIRSEALHSSKSNTHRAKVVNHIKSREIKFLIATDLASRGLDIDNITHVINFDVPPKVTDYVHRIGRTGRADLDGFALTLCGVEERGFFKAIEDNRNIELLTHAYHSDAAKNATAKDINPPSRKAPFKFKPKKKKKSFNYRK